MPGPLPKSADKRTRRNSATFETVMLPAEGRTGPVPRWPLSGRTPAGWKALWRMPQAIMWEKAGCVHIVARMLRIRTLVEDPMYLEDITASALSELRLMEDRLGMSPKALRDLRWAIQEEQAEEEPKEANPARGSRRARLRVMEGEG